jgi:NitT/TauT family transport system ATP-binding protein
MLQAELLTIWKRTGKTIVFITHGIDEAIFLGQRVAIMTSRPGRIKQLIEIPESIRDAGLEARAHPEFGRVRQVVWNLLREEVLKSQRERRSLVNLGARTNVDSEVASHG